MNYIGTVIKEIHIVTRNFMCMLVEGQDWVLPVAICWLARPQAMGHL